MDTQTECAAVTRVTGKLEAYADNPVCTVIANMVRQNRFEQSMSSPPLLLEPFNQILDAASSIEELPAECQGETRAIVRQATVVYVKLLHKQLIAANEKQKQKLRDATLEALTAGMQLAKRALPLLMATGLPTPVVNAVTEAVEGLPEPELKEGEEKKGFWSSVKGFVNAVFDVFESFFSTTRYNADFYKAITAIIEKLGRYADVIGKSVPIAEMIRDYANWCHEVESKLVDEECEKISGECSKVMGNIAAFFILPVIGIVVGLIWAIFQRATGFTIVHYGLYSLIPIAIVDFIVIPWHYNAKKKEWRNTLSAALVERMCIAGLFDR